MARTPNLRVAIDAKFTLELNEAEIGALDAIFGYSPEAFLVAFKKNLGSAYVERYEAGVRSLHQRVRGVTGPALTEIKALRDKLNNALAQ